MQLLLKLHNASPTFGDSPKSTKGSPQFIYQQRGSPLKTLQNTYNLNSSPTKLNLQSIQPSMISPQSKQRHALSALRLLSENTQRNSDDDESNNKTFEYFDKKHLEQQRQQNQISGWDLRKNITITNGFRLTNNTNLNKNNNCGGSKSRKLKNININNNSRRIDEKKNTSTQFYQKNQSSNYSSIFGSNSKQENSNTCINNPDSLSVSQLNNQKNLVAYRLNKTQHNKKFQSLNHQNNNSFNNNGFSQIQDNSYILNSEDSNNGIDAQEYKIQDLSKINQEPKNNSKFSHLNSELKSLLFMFDTPADHIGQAIKYKGVIQVLPNENSINQHSYQYSQNISYDNKNQQSQVKISNLLNQQLEHINSINNYYQTTSQALENSYVNSNRPQTGSNQNRFNLLSKVIKKRSVSNIVSPIFIYKNIDNPENAFSQLQQNDNAHISQKDIEETINAAFNGGQGQQALKSPNYRNQYCDKNLSMDNLDIQDLDLKNDINKSREFSSISTKNLTNNQNQNRTKKYKQRTESTNGIQSYISKKELEAQGDRSIQNLIINFQDDKHQKSMKQIATQLKNGDQSEISLYPFPAEFKDRIFRTTQFVQKEREIQININNIISNRDTLCIKGQKDSQISMAAVLKQKEKGQKPFEENKYFGNNNIGGSGNNLNNFNLCIVNSISGGGSKIIPNEAPKKEMKKRSNGLLGSADDLQYFQKKIEIKNLSFMNKENEDTTFFDAQQSNHKKRNNDKLLQAISVNNKNNSNPNTFFQYNNSNLMVNGNPFSNEANYNSNQYPQENQLNLQGAVPFSQNSTPIDINTFNNNNSTSLNGNGNYQSFKEDKAFQQTSVSPMTPITPNTNTGIQQNENRLIQKEVHSNFNCVFERNPYSNSLVRSIVNQYMNENNTNL